MTLLQRAARSAKAIARCKQDTPAPVPDRKCEHAAQVVLYALSAVFLVEMNNGFGITASPSEG